MRKFLLTFIMCFFVAHISAQGKPQQNWFWGYVDNDYGYSIGNTAPSGHCLIGNGSMYVDSSNCGAAISNQSQGALPLGTSTTSINAHSNTIYASRFSGADAGLQIAAAMQAVSNNGTVVADFNGTQTMSLNPFAGITKSVTLKFTGCATYTLDASMNPSSGNGYSQAVDGAGQNCTILQDGVGNITLLALGGQTNASDMELKYNGNTNVIALTQASNSTAERITINGGFPTYGVLRSGGPGTGIFSAHTVDVTVNGTGTAPQYGLAEISTPVGYVGLNVDDNFQANSTSVAAYYLDGGNSGGPTSCNNCDLGGNNGVGLWDEYAIANIQGDCENNTLGNVYINPANLLNAASTIHCQSAQDIFNTITGITGTIANNSSSLTVSSSTGINPGAVINVAGSTFSDTSSTYERVTAVSGTTITLAHPTTSIGGVTGAAIFGPVTPQYLQNGPGYPSTYSTELFTEQQKFLESPYIRRAWIESPISIRPNINAPTESIWRLCGGSAGNACTNQNTDLDITDNNVNIVADFNATNLEINAGSGGYGISGCCTIIDGSGNINSHGTISVQGSQIVSATGILKMMIFTVGTLPSASTAGNGATVQVSDASSFTIGTCVGGGTDRMIAVSDGTTWTCH